MRRRRGESHEAFARRQEKRARRRERYEDWLTRPRPTRKQVLAVAELHLHRALVLNRWYAIVGARRRLARFKEAH